MCLTMCKDLSLAQLFSDAIWCCIYVCTTSRHSCYFSFPILSVYLVIFRNSKYSWVFFWLFYVLPTKSHTFHILFSKSVKPIMTPQNWSADSHSSRPASLPGPIPYFTSHSFASRDDSLCNCFDLPSFSLITLLRNVSPYPCFCLSIFAYRY